MILSTMYVKSALLLYYKKRNHYIINYCIVVAILLMFSNKSNDMKRLLLELLSLERIGLFGNDFSTLYSLNSRGSDPLKFRCIMYIILRFINSLNIF